MGDFNVNPMKLNEDISLEYKDILRKYDLTNVIENPIQNGNVLLHHIITNTIENVSTRDVLPCPFISDHDASFITINVKIMLQTKIQIYWIIQKLWYGKYPSRQLHVQS